MLQFSRYDCITSGCFRNLKDQRIRFDIRFDTEDGIIENATMEDSWKFSKLKFPVGEETNVWTHKKPILKKIEIEIKYKCINIIYLILKKQKIAKKLNTF